MWIKERKIAVLDIKNQNFVIEFNDGSSFSVDKNSDITNLNFDLLKDDYSNIEKVLYDYNNHEMWVEEIPFKGKQYLFDGREFFEDTIETLIGDAYAQEGIVSSIEHAKEKRIRTLKKSVDEFIENNEREKRIEEERELFQSISNKKIIIGENLAITNAFNRTINEINSLNTSVKDVLEYPFEIKEEDYAVNYIISKLQFLRRFTLEERQVIRNKKDNELDPIIIDFWDLLTISSSIDLSDIDIVNSIDYLISIGVIDPTRKDIILELPNE